MLTAFLWMMFFSISAQALTLDEALQSALQKNESVAQSTEKVRQAQEQADQAKAATLPSLNASATYFMQPEHPDPLAKEFFPAKQTTTALTLNQPLFRGFREFATLRQRDRLLTAQKEDRKAHLVNLYQQVATSFLEVLARQQDVVNLTEQQKLSAERVKELTARVRRGESNANESLTAQATSAVLEAEVQIVQSQLKAAKENFSLLTGLPEDTVLTDPSGENLNLGPLEKYLNGVEERPDIKSAQQRAEASEEDISVAKGGHWPSADFTGNYYLQRPDGYLKDQKWDVQFRLTVPLFEGGLRDSQVREAASKNREAQLQLTALRRKSLAEIRVLFESVKMRRDQLKSLKLAAELSEKNYQVLQRDYRRGLTRNLDVQLAMNDFRLAKRSYDQARFLARLDLIRLEAAAAILPSSLKKEM